MLNTNSKLQSVRACATTFIRLCTTSAYCLRCCLVSLLCGLCLMALPIHAADDTNATGTVDASNVTENGTLATDLNDVGRLDTWEVRRQVMSQRGVLVDMETLRENGYTWVNDAVWEGTDKPVNEKWYIAGFLFERKGFKNVWLQYAFTYDDGSGKLASFRTWSGGTVFR